LQNSKESFWARGTGSRDIAFHFLPHLIQFIIGYYHFILYNLTIKIVIK